MRFAILLALAATTLAGVVPRQVIHQYHCGCPADLTGSSGHFIKMDYSSWQCAYPEGACTWDLVSSGAVGFETLQ
jgi:hypothetical protein